MSDHDTSLEWDTLDRDVSFAIFWDRCGETQELESFPQSFKHWELGEPLDGDVQLAVIRKLEDLFAKQVVRTELRAIERNLVLEIEYDDGHESILRMPNAATGSDGEFSQDLTLFTREIALLQWLASNASLPVPRLLAVVHRSDSESCAFAVMEKLPGNCVMNIFGGLSFGAKESIVRDMANFMLELNGLVVPQRIGTTVIQEDAIGLVPLEFLALHFSPGRVFDTLEEFIGSLVREKRESARIGTDDASKARANQVLDRLTARLPSIFERVSAPVYRRCIMSHDDLNETNVLIGDDGRISGVIDWELHSVRPVVLAAQYPLWLRYDGIFDPRFCLRETWWLTSPEDAEKLRAIYSEAVKSTNEDYWRALVEGELLRQCYEWLTDPAVDPGCSAMARWMDDVFGLDSAMETNV